MKSFIALLLYRLLLLLNLPIIIIVLLIRSTKHRAYRHRLFERLGLLPARFKAGGIVIHAASVGEVIALKAFIEQVLLAYPGLPITLTTFTPTGSAQGEKLFGRRVQHCYLPLDIMPCTASFLHKLAPKAMVFMETELWPNLLCQAGRKKIPLLLINGRLSANSMKSYKKVSWLITPALQEFSGILCQSLQHRDNFIRLGAQESSCSVSGNLKFDISLSSDLTNTQTELARLLGENRPVWIAASTHDGDEQLILESFKHIRQSHPDLLLVIAPRHPERFEKVHQLCQAQGFSVIKRSSKTTVTPTTQVWLLDTLGELMASYGLSTIVTIGGSFSNIGGHNPLEPALFKKPIIVGPDMANFAAIHQQLLQQQAIIALPSEESGEEAGEESGEEPSEKLGEESKLAATGNPNKEPNEVPKKFPKQKPEQLTVQLTNQLMLLLDNPEVCQQLGENAYRIVQQNQGASKHSVAALKRLL